MICVIYIISNNILILLEGNNDIFDARSNNQAEMNENEEMMSAIEIEIEEVEDNMELDVENEETSEDEIEFYISDEESEYERTITEFDESDEEDGNDQEETIEDEEVIIDKPFSNEQIPQTFGEFAPYFKNITEALFFCWMQKHHICKLNPFKSFINDDVTYNN